MKYILAIDQGTTGTTSALIDTANYKIIAKSNKEFKQIYPEPGLVEHDLNDIWTTVESTVTDVIKKANINKDDICSIGITNQRETTCAFDQHGKPLANAIVWQDRRTIDFCNSIKNKEKIVKEITGLPIDPYFSATKMKWLLDNNEDVSKASIDKSLHFGTIDTFLLFKLTNNKSFFTESSNASRTLLMSLADSTWNKELLSLFDINKESLPEIKNSFDNFGKTESISFLPDGIPITGILGDQQSALFGQAGFNKGDMKCTYGTGAFLLFNTGKEQLTSNNGLLTTVAYQQDGQNVYALEGSSYIAGAAVQWLRDNLKVINNASDVEKLAGEVTDLNEMKNILFLPYFSGIGSPHWKPEALAAIIGMTRDTGNSHIARACLDGICFSINDIVTSVSSDTGIAVCALRVDGGAAANNLLMEIQSTITDTSIIRPKVIETTVFGAALASAIGSILITMNDISNFWEKDREFSPNKQWSTHYNSKKVMWDKTVNSLFF